MNYRPTVVLLLIMVLALAAAPAWAEKCEWSSPGEVETTCTSKCAGHQNPEACKAACPQAVNYYKPWTAKECTVVTQGECAGELGHYQMQQNDPAAKVSYGFVIYYGCFGGKGKKP